MNWVATKVRLTAVLAGLILAVAGCGGDDEGGSTTDESTTAQSETSGGSVLDELDAEEVAARVEKLRELSFSPTPSFSTVTPEESASYFEKKSGDLSPAELEKQEATIERLKLTGLIPPDLEVGELASTLGGEAALGYYDGETQELSLVEGPASEDPQAAEAVLAHELTHALQDQMFDSFETNKKLMSGDDADAASAYGALVEGDGRLLEDTYAKQFGATASAGGEQQASQAEEDLPFALVLDLSLRYEIGAEFIAALVEEGGYEAVDQAFEENPPTTMAQILDPERYLSGDEPTDVKLSVKPILGQGWSLVDSSTFGEADLIELLAFDEQQVKATRDAVAGWDGGEIELWSDGKFDPKACPAPCVEKDALIGAVHWLSAKDAEGFETAFGDSIEGNRDGKPAGAGIWTVGEGAVAIGTAGTETTIAYAPTEDLAKQLAEGAG